MENSIQIPKYGFIITRHVNSEITNHYWNECIKCIRKYHDINIKIIIIDDNSDQQLVKAFEEYENVEYVQSEFPKRGELLPYYYFYKNHYFENAVILHDSVFIQRKIQYQDLKINVLPLWHFKLYRNENILNSIRISNYLKNNELIKKELLSTNEFFMNMNFKKTWNGCFGCQSYINYHFLILLENKYKLFNLLECVKTRPDRCCLERILGILFFLEEPRLNRCPSFFGDILKYCSFNLTYHQYHDHMKIKKYYNLPYIKVWTGR
jgi:hypothetical protein